MLPPRKCNCDMLRRRHAPLSNPRADTDHAGTEFGWRSHEAIQTWTANVDTKASIAMVVQTALAGAGLHALIAHDGELHDAVGLHLACTIVAVTLLVISVGCCLWVIFPRLHRRRDPPPQGLIYFGDLRILKADEIALALTTLTQEQECTQLAHQMRITSVVAWRKHSWLQHSLVAFVLGATLLVTSYVAF